jgi:uncharacterized membrane protein
MAGHPAGHTLAMPLVTAAAGSIALVVIVLLIVAGVVVGYYTRRGNDITERPSDGLGHGDGSEAPGAEGPGRIAGKDDGEQDPFSTHGTA